CSAVLTQTEQNSIATQRESPFQLALRALPCALINPPSASCSPTVLASALTTLTGALGAGPGSVARQRKRRAQHMVWRGGVELGERRWEGTWGWRLGELRGLR